ncbi:MAG: sugar-binding protein, partial [Myxococcota bacterium]
VLRAVAGGVDLPVDYLTRADSGRLRALRQGAVTGVARGDAIEIRIHNVTDAPLAGVLTVEPGGWTVANPTVPYEVAPGETFTATVPASAPAGWFPSPRLSLSYPLPDAGPVAFVTPVDAVREAVAPRGAAVVDGRLDDWAGAPSVGPLTTALGGLATTEATEVWLRHDDEALYVAARCADSEPAQLSRLHTDRDRQVVFDDRIGLVLFPTPDQLVWFYVNPNGAVWDLRRVGADLQRGWDGVEAAATVDEGGYSVEARIPFAALGLGEVPQTWSFDLRRRQERTQTEATFTSAFASRDPARIGILHLSP